MTPRERDFRHRHSGTQALGHSGTLRLTDSEAYLLELIAGAGAIGIDINGLVVRISQGNIQMRRPDIQAAVSLLVRQKLVGLDLATGNYFAK